MVEYVWGYLDLRSRLYPAVHTPLLLTRECVKKSAEDADTPHPDTPILTLNRTGVRVVMLGEGV